MKSKVKKKIKPPKPDGILKKYHEKEVAVKEKRVKSLKTKEAKKKRKKMRR
jgi:hypothetical protein